MSRRRPTEPTANPARGIVLVVVAVLIGLFLLRNGIDTSVSTSGPTGSDGSSSTDGDTGTDSGTDAGSSTSSSVVGARAPGQVPAIVLNGSGVQGAAKKYSTALLNKGYTALTNPDGGNATNTADVTSVFYGAGFEAEAAAVAVAIGAPPTSVAALGTSTPGTTSGASVVVVLGKDLGDKDPPA